MDHIFTPLLFTGSTFIPGIESLSLLISTFLDLFGQLIPDLVIGLCWNKT